MRRYGILLVVTIGLLFTNGCFINRTGTDSTPAPTLMVEPEYICPGEQATVRWNLNLVRDNSNCTRPYGGYESLTSCASRSDCPPDAVTCIDGSCSLCQPDLLRDRVECGDPPRAGCYPNFGFTLASSPGGVLVPPVSGVTDPRQVSGERTFTPVATTHITLTGGYLDVPSSHSGDFTSREISVRVAIVEDLGYTAPRTAEFYCTPGGRGWQWIDLATMASSAVALTTLSNRNPFDINAQREEWLAPIRIPGMRSSEAFAGPMRGRIFVTIPEDQLLGRGTPSCPGTVISDPYPDIDVALRLVCSPD